MPVWFWLWTRTVLIRSIAAMSKNVMSEEVGFEDARNMLGHLIWRANAGEVVYLTFHGRRVAALVPLDRISEEEAGAAPDLQHATPHRRQPPSE